MIARLISTFLLGAELRQARLYFAWALYATILIAGSIPNARVNIGQVASGLMLHSVAYSVITFLLWSGLRHGRWGNPVRAFLIVAAMGAFDEFVQGFFPYRTAAFGDWAIDCGAGAVTASICSLILYRCLPPARQLSSGVRK